MKTKNYQKNMKKKSQNFSLNNYYNFMYVSADTLIMKSFQLTIQNFIITGDNKIGISFPLILHVFSLLQTGPYPGWGNYKLEVRPSKHIIALCTNTFYNYSIIALSVNIIIII